MKKEEKTKLANELAELNKQYSLAISRGEDTSIYRQKILEICTKYGM